MQWAEKGIFLVCIMLLGWLSSGTPSWFDTLNRTSSRAPSRPLCWAPSGTLCWAPSWTTSWALSGMNSGWLLRNNRIYNPSRHLSRYICWRYSW